MDAVVIVDPVQYQRRRDERDEVSMPLRSLHFGPDGGGLVTFLVYPPDDLVLVVKIQWLGGQQRSALLGRPYATGRGHALIGRWAVTFRNWHPVVAMVRRGPVRGPSHPCKGCNQGHRRHGSGVSVQLAHSMHEALVS
jgi:hypothetical protein